jgi:hypothetical protein
MIKKSLHELRMKLEGAKRDGSDIKDGIEEFEHSRMRY